MGVPRNRRTLGAVALVASLALSGTPLTAAESVPLDKLERVHDLSVDPLDGARLLLATHAGVFLAGRDGLAERISDAGLDLTSLVPHPTEPERMFASGRLPDGGGSGVLVSDDAGRTWRRVSGIVEEPGEFRLLIVSRVDPEVMFGARKGTLRASRDGGRSWTEPADLPTDVFGLTASATDARTLYAATRGGLFASTDAGRSWQPANPSPQPMTTVHVTAGGRLYVFVYGDGLYAADERDLELSKLSGGYFDRALFRLKSDSREPDRLYAIADTGTVMTSENAGRSWTTFEGSHLLGAVAEGKKLYETNCQECHGVRAVGERPDDMYAKDEFGYVAPPLDDSAHGWHHTDRDLVERIMTGSPRNERMVAFKETLTREQAAKIVAYIKSLWNFRSLACQGPQHMKCMKR